MSYGKYTYGRIQVHTSGAELKVGSFWSIADNVSAFVGGNHRMDWVTTFPFGNVHQHIFNTIGVQPRDRESKGDIIIGNDVWIGSNAVIMSGVTVGHGAVIANNAHVVEPYSIVGGNPAKLIRYRFTPEQIEKLLQIKWWDWEDSKINNFTSQLCNDNIDEFIRLAEPLVHA